MPAAIRWLPQTLLGGSWVGGASEMASAALASGAAGPGVVEWLKKAAVPFTADPSNRKFRNRHVPGHSSVSQSVSVALGT